MRPNTYVLNLFRCRLLREWFFPSFLRRFSDTASYHDGTSSSSTKEVDFPSKSSKNNCLDTIKIESEIDLIDDYEELQEEEDEVVVANTRANSLTNVAQYSKISAAVKATEDVPKPPTKMKGKSSLAIAAAATSIMFSMPAQVFYIN